MGFLLDLVNWKFELVYLDEVFIFLNTPGEHVDPFREFLTFFKDAGINTNSKNFFFSRNRIDYTFRPGSL